MVSEAARLVAADIIAERLPVRPVDVCVRCKLYPCPLVEEVGSTRRGSEMCSLAVELAREVNELLQGLVERLRGARG